MFGPLIDVPNGIMGGSYQPAFKEAVFCAGCHEQAQAALLPGTELDARWSGGLPVHSTYGEWLAGPFAALDTPCQDCHMPPAIDRLNSIDTATVDNQSITFGYPRPPEDNRRHLFRGPLSGSPRLIDDALFADVLLAQEGDELVATVSLANSGCGHAVPTGEPMRALLLYVIAEGAGCDETLRPVGGMTAHDVAGALARGVEGVDVATTGTTMTWSAGAGEASAGKVVRVVRPSGLFDDYPGIGWFADPELPASEKGLEIHEAVGEATVVAVVGSELTLDQSLSPNAGDVVYLGDAITLPPSDGQASLHLAGAAGYTFSKILVDDAGTRGVAHYRAIDIASDNRIPPGETAFSLHRFAPLTGCNSATVTAFVLYRPVPLSMATERGWDANDYLIATATRTIAPR
jgi:hypothetical protein